MQSLKVTEFGDTLVGTAAHLLPRLFVIEYQDIDKSERFRLSAMMIAVVRIQKARSGASAIE